MYLNAKQLVLNSYLRSELEDTYIKLLATSVLDDLCTRCQLSIEIQVNGQTSLCNHLRSTSINQDHIIARLDRHG